MSFYNNKKAKSEVWSRSRAERDDEFEERQNNLQLSASKNERNSSLYGVPEFQGRNDDDDSSRRRSTDSKQSVASEELQRHNALNSDFITLAEIDMEFAILNIQEYRRQRAEDRVWECGEALHRAKKDEAEAQQALMKAKRNCQARRTYYNAFLDRAGVSPQLIDEYEAFCESLQPKVSRSGFSILCDNPHNGDYIDYDPEFEHFKDYVEESYRNKNFRCEASSRVSKKFGRYNRRAQSMEHVVEFFRLADIEPLTGSERTWGEQYPKLYRLAIQAAKRGSGLALDILVRLPEKDCRFKGGWLFDYEFDELARNDRVLSNRWKFRSAHRIDEPVSARTKRRHLKLEHGIY